MYGCKYNKISKLSPRQLNNILDLITDNFKLIWSFPGDNPDNKMKWIYQNKKGIIVLRRYKGGMYSLIYHHGLNHREKEEIDW